MEPNKSNLWLACVRGKHDKCLGKHPDTCKCSTPPPNCGCECHKTATEASKQAA